MSRSTWVVTPRRGTGCPQPAQLGRLASGESLIAASSLFRGVAASPEAAGALGTIAGAQESRCLGCSA